MQRVFKVPESKDVGYDDNPYSRLAALQAMGVVPDIERIRRRSVAVIGVGGVGAIVADCLARCGIGELHLFDPDVVSAANMNRLFYTPSHIGLFKVAAAANVLAEINPDCKVTAHPLDITSADGFQVLKNTFSTISGACSAPSSPPIGPSLLGVSNPAGIDGVAVCCVDNYAARTSVNAAALATGCVWIECGVSDDAVRGHIQTFSPGVGPCYECSSAVAVAEQREPRRRGVCAASLPMTMTPVGCFGAMRALKALLGFGTLSVGEYFGWNAVEEWARSEPSKRNPECSKAVCVVAQAAADAAGAVVGGAGAAEIAHGGGDDGGWGEGCEAADIAAGFKVVSGGDSAECDARPQRESGAVGHMHAVENSRGGIDVTPPPAVSLEDLRSALCDVQG